MNEEVGTQINVLFSEQVREKKKEIGIDEEIKSKNSKWYFYWRRVRKRLKFQ